LILSKLALIGAVALIVGRKKTFTPLSRRTLERTAGKAQRYVSDVKAGVSRFPMELDELKR
jgi:hypothetical protein